MCLTVSVMNDHHLSLLSEVDNVRILGMIHKSIAEVPDWPDLDAGVSVAELAEVHALFDEDTRTGCVSLSV